jgi:S-adenosylmethionine synthetase
MARDRYLFTSESVAEGHPDKVCDQISDSLVDAYLRQDPLAHVALETLATLNTVVLAGEVTSKAPLSLDAREQIMRQVIKNIGYEDPLFHWQQVRFHDLVHEQSTDIALGVDQEAGQVGAGDQGMMMGYACDETPVFMPAPLYYCHRLLESLQTDRKSGLLPGLGADAKSQLTVLYENKKPIGVTQVVISIQHSPDLQVKDVRNLVLPYIHTILPKGWMRNETQVHVNPTGRFVQGGPAADTGLTGRKIIVDTYGAAAPHGGGAFSGKDPTKVDRSAAYMARYIAKNIVAAGLAQRCTVQLAYGIGLAEPLSFMINTHGTGTVPHGTLEETIMDFLDLTPRGIIGKLDLRQPIYQPTASYGHFGRPPKEGGFFSWEVLDLVDSLQERFSSSKVALK